jgi:hypothetical protein
MPMPIYYYNNNNNKEQGKNNKLGRKINTYHQKIYAKK